VDELNIDELNEQLKKARRYNPVIVFSEHGVHANWEHVKSDCFNNRPDIDTPEEYVAEARAGLVTYGGAKVIISETLTQ